MILHSDGQQWEPFNVPFIERQSYKMVSTNHNFWRERSVHPQSSQLAKPLWTDTWSPLDTSFPLEKYAGGKWYHFPPVCWTFSAILAYEENTTTTTVTDILIILRLVSACTGWLTSWLWYAEELIWLFYHLVEKCCLVHIGHFIAWWSTKTA